MLTPIDIQNRQLKQKMGGYDKKDTDDFLNEVIANYEELYKENQALKEKITSLSEGIQYYKKMEGTLQKALVLAEKTSSETQEAAKSQADSMMTEASVKAEALSRETKAEIDALRAEAQAQAEVTKAKANRELEETRNHVRKLVQSYENYRLQFKKLAEAQIEMLESESFSIFVPELDELMNEAPSADSVMDNPGIIPINIGSPAPFVDLPDETGPEKSVSNASVVEELPVSIAIPVSSTEPFTAPPADDMESAPSIDLNVTSSVIENAGTNKPSLEVDLGTGAAINIPISAGAFVSPDDDIAEENASVEPSANSGVPTAEPSTAPATESPFMDIPVTPVDATVPSMDIPATPVDTTVPSMNIPATPVDTTVPSMDIPVTPVDATVPSMDIPVAPVDATVPSMDIPVTPIDSTVPSIEIPITSTGEMPGAGTAGNSVEAIASSMEVPITPTAGTPTATMDGMFPSMDTAAANIQAGTAEASPFVDIPTAEPTASNAYQSPFVDPTADNTFMDVPVSQNAVSAQTNQAMPAMNNNAFMDIPAQTPPENNVANMDMQAAPVMNNAFVDMSMETSAGNNPANVGMQQNNLQVNPGMQANTMPINTMQANQAAPVMNNAFVDIPMETSPESNPANMGMQQNTLQVNPGMQANTLQANQAASAMNSNAFIDIPAQTSPESNPANMGMQMENPFMDIPMETPAADVSMMDSAQAAASAGGMLATEPQPAAPADNSLMADPFMDVGNMFDSPINDIPAEQEPAPEQNTQSVENFLDINPFNFIDPE